MKVVPEFNRCSECVEPLHVSSPTMHMPVREMALKLAPMAVVNAQEVRCSWWCQRDSVVTFVAGSTGVAVTRLRRFALPFRLGLGIIRRQIALFALALGCAAAWHLLSRGSCLLHSTQTAVEVDQSCQLVLIGAWEHKIL